LMRGDGTSAPAATAPATALPRKVLRESIPLLFRAGSGRRSGNCQAPSDSASWNAVAGRPVPLERPPQAGALSSSITRNAYSPINRTAGFIKPYRPLLGVRERRKKPLAKPWRQLSGTERTNPTILRFCQLWLESRATRWRFRCFHIRVTHSGGGLQK
jgi:hypothetical protein